MKTNKKMVQYFMYKFVNTGMKQRGSFVIIFEKSANKAKMP